MEVALAEAAATAVVTEDAAVVAALVEAAVMALVEAAEVALDTTAVVTLEETTAVALEDTAVVALVVVTATFVVVAVLELASGVQHFSDDIVKCPYYLIQQRTESTSHSRPGSDSRRYLYCSATNYICWYSGFSYRL